MKLKNIFKTLRSPSNPDPKSPLNGGIKEKVERSWDRGIHPFKHILSNSDIYAEYGCGDSTIWVATHTECKIYSVDTSAYWLDKVRTSCPRSKDVTLHLTDVGELGDWGRPLSYEKFDKFDDYTDWIWKQPDSANVVLIDGRFRVCCFLTSLLYANEGTKILFDDYKSRKYYHFVERFLVPEETRGTQALFLVPSKAQLDENSIKKAINQFRFVLGS